MTGTKPWRKSLMTSETNGSPTLPLDLGTLTASKVSPKTGLGDTRVCVRCGKKAQTPVDELLWWTCPECKKGWAEKPELTEEDRRAALAKTAAEKKAEMERIIASRMQTFGG